MKKFVPLKKQSKYDRKQAKALLRKLSSKEDFFCYSSLCQIPGLNVAAGQTCN